MVRCVAKIERRASKTPAVPASIPIGTRLIHVRSTDPWAGWTATDVTSAFKLFCSSFSSCHKHGSREDIHYWVLDRVAVLPTKRGTTDLVP